MASLAHDDDAALATALRHWGDPAEGSQRVIISPAHRLRRLGQERGEDNPSAPGKDRRIVTWRCSGSCPDAVFSSPAANSPQSVSRQRCGSLICRLTSLGRAATARICALAASTVLAAAASGRLRQRPGRRREDQRRPAVSERVGPQRRRGSSANDSKLATSERENRTRGVLDKPSGALQRSPEGPER
jgi:hypothetical protein